jgi:cytosine/creatinine deaminase
LTTSPFLGSLESSADELGYRTAYEQAAKSFGELGIPVGAALTLGTELIAAGHNERVQKGDPIAHGEMSCLRNAGRRRDYAEMTLFTTLSPCWMCTGAILLFGIPRVVVGEATTFAGDLDFLHSQGVEIVLLNDKKSIELMTRFQTEHAQIWREDIGK